MRYCLNCGAENPPEPCEHCGLTLQLAALVFRRRLVFLTAIFLLGTVAFLPAAKEYPPLELDQMLVFLGVVAAVALLLAVVLDQRARRGQPLEALRRVFRALLPLPWMLSLLLYVNGRFDRTPPIIAVTHVVSKFTMPGLVRPHRLIVHSWRPNGRLERLPVDEDDYSRFRAGDTVEVRVAPGFVGIPWVYSVLRHDPGLAIRGPAQAHSP
ncbi:MAG TPA: hypothetical protein VEG63_08665 [Candidatus Acidoferrales bacterium]|nr:hypothetical protein [Candidatus Acidoferrales bacterium]